MDGKGKRESIGDINRVVDDDDDDDDDDDEDDDDDDDDDDDKFSKHEYPCGGNFTKELLLKQQRR